MSKMREVIFPCKRNKRKACEVGGEEMKYLKSFLGTLILLLLVLLITTPVITIALLSGFVSLWFLFGEIVALPMSILIVIKLAVSDKLDWVLGLMSAAFDE